MLLSDRMKQYEGIIADQMLIPGLPIVARIDGRAFHTWTKGLQRPYDNRLQLLFDEVTKFLVDETDAVVGFTQSDEINLILCADGWDSQTLFNGRICKLTSVLASMTTAKFNSLITEFVPQKSGRLAFFDARVFNVPSAEESVNCLIWRELDATRNSIQMAAQSQFSHKQLDHRNTSEMQEMLWQKGINWNDYPARFKRGGYFKRRLIERKMTFEEIDKLPPLHDARKNPDLIVERHVMECLDIPPLMKIPNRVEVIFEGAEPQKTEEIAA